MKIMAKTNKKKAGNVPNPIPPAGMRPDSRGEHGVPHPNDDSVWEAYKWRKTHSQ